MKRSRLIVAGWLTLQVALQPAFAFADPADTALTQNQINVIKTTCVSAQGQIQRAQVNDIVVRTNRGGTYAALLKLMDALDVRASANGYDTSTLAPITSSLHSKFDDFTRDFTKYDNSMDDVVSRDCQAHPEVFYASLTQTRGLRNQLAGDVHDMDDLVSQYASAVDQLNGKITERAGVK